MDAGPFYALLRFEEAALALRATLRLNLIDRLGDDRVSPAELRDLMAFTDQGARTFFALLRVMQILDLVEGRYAVSERAQACLSDGKATSRKPYLEMGAREDVEALVALLRGQSAPDALPVYAADGAGKTLMDLDDVAADIARGLASRARNFARPLAAALARHAVAAEVLADIGAGSPYLADACLQQMHRLKKVVLVDRPNGMRFAREMAATAKMDTSRLEYCEQDFFQQLPRADAYTISNTAHDWLLEDYARIVRNIRQAISGTGLVCVHEPLLRLTWQSDREWLDALWMACYALTLFKLTLGQGSCYTREEHDALWTSHGFQLVAEPEETCDGCTALFYRPTG